MSRQASAARVEQLAARVGEEQQVEIVEVELKGTGRNQLLRVSIDKAGGVTHGDCERVSHALGVLLENETVLHEQYTLEVSSPGVERKLKKLNDFERFKGQKVKVVVRQGASEEKPAEKKSRFVEGTLAGTEEQLVLLDVAGGERLKIPFDQIDRANLKFEW